MASVFDAVYRGDTEALKRLLEADPAVVHRRDMARARCMVTPLFYACRKGHVAAARLLLDHGAKVNAHQTWKGADTTSCLMVACRHGRVDVARVLLERGADVCMRDSRWGLNALDEAAAHGHLDTLRLLLCHVPGRVDAGNRWSGTTCLMQAARRGQVEAARVLVMEGGADHTARDRRGRTAVDVAREEGQQECLEFLRWFEDELERAYCLAKARRAGEEESAAAGHAGSRGVGGAGRQPATVGRPWLAGRVASGAPLPRLEVEEEGEGGQEDAVVAVLRHVVGDEGLKEDLFLELLAMMSPR